MALSPTAENLSRDVMRIAGRIGAIETNDGPEDPRLPELRRQLAWTRHELHVQKIVDAAPPLTVEQRRQLRLLLSPAVEAAEGDESVAS